MLRRRLTLVLAVLSCGCATLNTSGMPEHCRRLYDACLNSCPSAASPPPGAIQNWRTDVAGCTDDCNRKAKQCN